MRIIEISLTILSVILVVICVPKPIQYNNGEYEGLVVTIHPDITDSDQLVANLKELLIKSSAFLYGATESRAQFKDIAVILPKSWPQKDEYNKILDSHWDDGHIRIVPSAQSPSDKPFVLQPRGCRQSGEYIQLTDNFVKELNDIIRNTFDYPDKLLVNEWSHYRYGVFDEFGSAGDYRYPTFYMTNGTIYPTFCVSGIKGNAEDMNGNTCKIYSTGRVDHNCKFIADKSDNSPIASIMSLPHYQSTQGTTIIMITDGYDGGFDPYYYGSEASDAGVKVDVITIGYNVEQTLNNISAITGELGNNTKFLVHSTNIQEISVKIRSPNGQIFDMISKPVNKNQFMELLITDSEVGDWKVELSKMTPGWPLGDILAELSVTSEPKDPTQQPIRVNAFFGHLEVRYPSNALIYVQLMKAYNPVIGAKVVAVVQRPGDQTIELDLYDDGAGPDIRANDGVYTTAFTQFTQNDRYSVSAKITDIPSVTKLRTYGKTLRMATESQLLIGLPQIQDYPTLPGLPAPTGTPTAPGAPPLPSPPIIIPPSPPHRKVPKSEFQINDFIATDGTEPEETIISIPIAPFTRGAEVGAFLVDNFNPGVDGMSPGRVTDLQVITSEDNRTVELQWTAPGDDSYTGKATKIDLRTSLRPETLYRQELFDSNVVIDDQMLDTGSLAPPEGHTIMRVKFQIPSALLMSANTPKVTVYFGLRAVDDNSNWGEVSNIAFINVEPLPDPIPTTTTSIPPNTTTPPSSGSSCGNTSCGDKTVIETRHTVVVLQKIVRMETNLKNQTAVQIPKELGLNTTFTVTSDGITLLNVTLESPNGTVYGMTSDWAVSKPSESSAGFRIPVADAGQWSVGLEKTRSDAVVADVSVTSDERVGQSYE
ncbi:unnamed protein product [Medioppia subpectinata]|uniref:Calcium-activated chloride channel N-terminal domain-containing protein n=1 Tax=Medioppia subpectinata TaxID=1979941 RepID=A0A7R9KIS3_9ACAR|nr:unnamed protein product [Medioppia subpectinata]CAG2104285.1 unnamed protein product [Medioppia subpectinata]